MDACGCDEFALEFDRRTAEKDRDRYHRSGPDRTTVMLLDMLRPYVGTGSTMLDVGGGIGIVHQELLRAGVGHAVLVDASRAYLDVARTEARSTGVLDRLEIVEGDFVRRAPEIDPADIVTLDRVVCCYGDVRALVGGTAARARRVYGLVLPRDRAVFRLVARILNATYRLRRKAYRAYAHSNALVDALTADAGLRPVHEARTFLWRVVVYERAAS